MKHKPITIGAIIVVLVAAWALFRPELLFVNKSVSESFPVSGTAVVAPAEKSMEQPELTGQFHTVAHDTKGTAAIFKLADGQRVLRLTNFMTSNGPDVRVLLVAASDAGDSDAVKKAGYVELGKLKGNRGNQVYPLPDDLDLSNVRSVTIWCARFAVSFGAAELSKA